MNRKHPNEEFDIILSQKIKNKCNHCNKINFKNIHISEEAQITIGDAIIAIADHYQIDTNILTKSITENIFNVDGDLVIIFDIPELECENIITIPKSYWNSKEQQEKINKSIKYH